LWGRFPLKFHSFKLVCVFLVSIVVHKYGWQSILIIRTLKFSEELPELIYR